MYKLMSSVIANRLKSVLDKIVSNDQKGFISGRYIGENIWTIYGILFETKRQNIPGLMLSVDFQQAFDTGSWKFIEKILDYFNFGPSIKKVNKTVSNRCTVMHFAKWLTFRVCYFAKGAVGKGIQYNLIFLFSV